MAVGSYVIDNGHAATVAMSSGYTLVNKMKFDRPIELKSVRFKSATTGTVTGKAVVWFGGVKIGESTSSTKTVSVANTYYEWELSSTLGLSSNLEYYIGFYSSAQSGAFIHSCNVSTTPHTHTSSPGGITASISDSMSYYASGDVNPTTFDNGRELPMEITFEPNTLPTAPTGVTSNTPVILGNPLTVNWTHNDANGDQQVKYQIRYRKKDS